MAKHLKLMSHKIAEMHERPLRLIVTMPPRHGKSELISKWTNLWYLSNWPKKHIILCSYEKDFAAEWGRRTRTLIETYGQQIDLYLSKHSTAASRWETSEGGGMVTAGVGGAITGRGADLLIVDDPVKNAEEANSKVIRDKIWDWWDTTAITRLEPQGSIIIVMTRWHEDDLVGRLLEDNIENWETINFPAIAEEDDVLGRVEGDALWPMRYTIDDLLLRKQRATNYHFSALYQQRPIPKEGAMFREDWFEIIDHAPELETILRWWDMAATTTKRSDYTVGVKVGVSKGQYFILDVERFRGTPKQVEDAIRSKAESDGHAVAIRIEQEPGSSGLQIIDHYARDILKGFNFKGIPSTGSKEVRAGPFAAAAENGNVKLIKGSWNKEYVLEVSKYPRVAHDDQVDGTSGAINQLTLNSIRFPYDGEKPRRKLRGHSYGLLDYKF